MTDAVKQAVLDAARTHALHAGLLQAQVIVESNGDPWAWNPEPRYRYLWNVKANGPFRQLTQVELNAGTPPADFRSLAGDPDQEWWAQRASWGLLQVMGAVARERGFKGAYLTQLADPATNLGIGCAHFVALLKWANGDAEMALAAYNGGKAGNVARPFRNAAYADRVMQKLKEVSNG